jgi:hypothetical protein
MLSFNYQDVWSEVKKLTGQLATQTMIVDNNSDPHDVVSSFAQKYSNLSSSVPYSDMDVTFIDHE